MFDIGWSELMLIGVVALIVIGPKELPSVLRTVGRTVTKLRRMAGEFQGQFQEALREADIADMRKEISGVAEEARSSMDTLATADMFDPLRSVREEIRSTVEGVKKPLTEPLSAPSGTAAPEAAGSLDFAPEEPKAAAPEAAASEAAAPALPEPLVPLPPDAPLPPPSFDVPEPVPASAPADAPSEAKKGAS